MSEKSTLIEAKDGELVVPNHPEIPFIEGDGIGPDIWRATSKVLDTAVEKAYGGDRKICWKEVLAGEKANTATGEWLPQATLDAFEKHLVGIKGPLTTPVGGGFTSLNVALRQKLDLYACVRPTRHFSGVPSPVKRPEAYDMITFRENSEDIYAGIEFEPGSEECTKFLGLLKSNFPDRYSRIRFDEQVGIGIKPVSEAGTKRLVRAALKHAIAEGKRNLTLVHKGNIMKFTEGKFRDWGYEVAREEFKSPLNGQTIQVKDVIADAFMQQLLTRPDEYDVIATLNLNGDYLSDEAAACVGGIGIAPGANINFDSGLAIFEATHGTAPKYAGQDKVNPGSLILSGEMMLRYMKWPEAADLIIKGLEAAIEDRQVTYDFARLLDGLEPISCSAFAEAVVERML
ncbi:UNVERIFIED_CONTAM: hypothetical protein GTU68_004894 [Idotea baltica]|nr:hypothetical protein [Idotea baltica]